jgi:stage IV sporulation protein FB
MGIQIRVHLTFLVFLAWVGLSDGMDAGWGAAVSGVALICTVFGCILLHELGHAFAARRYGIRTPDITLLPIGGMARLERIPERPREEMVVALAGPVVSAVLAVIFGLVSGFQFSTMDSYHWAWGGFASRLFTINTGLLLFNLLPVFPLDGGRVFRALLAMRFDYQRATRIAAAFGQVFAVGLAAAGLLLPAPMLVFVAIFLFLGAGSEAAQVEVRAAARGLRVADAMVTVYTVLPEDARLADAADLLVHAAQHHFPLEDASRRCVGLLTRSRLIEGLNEAGPLGAALTYARRDLPAVHPTQLFTSAYKLLRESGTSALPVEGPGGELIGLFTEENMGELIFMERAARSKWLFWRKPKIASA